MIRNVLRRAVMIALALCSGGAAWSATRAPASRPSLTTTTLHITLTGKCLPVREVSVVMDDDDRGRLNARRDDKDKCNWIATWPKTFDAGLSHFSLRLTLQNGVARTTCQPPSVDEKASIATVAFVCCKQPARQVVITTDPQMSVSYVRGVPADHKYDDASVDCTEQSPYLEQPIEIPAVWFPGDALQQKVAVWPAATNAFERVRLQLGESEPNLDLPSLIVNHATLTKYLKTADRGSLDTRQILDILQDQRLQGLARVPPECNENQREIDEKNLNDLHLKSVTVQLTVPK